MSRQHHSFRALCPPRLPGHSSYKIMPMVVCFFLGGMKSYVLLVAMSKQRWVFHLPHQFFPPSSGKLIINWLSLGFPKCGCTLHGSKAIVRLGSSGGNAASEKFSLANVVSFLGGILVIVRLVFGGCLENHSVLVTQIGGFSKGISFKIPSHLRFTCIVYSS